MQTAFEHICVYMKMYVYKNVNEHVYEYKDIYYIYIQITVYLLNCWHQTMTSMQSSILVLRTQTSLFYFNSLACPRSGRRIYLHHWTIVFASRPGPTWCLKQIISQGRNKVTAIRPIAGSNSRPHLQLVMGGPWTVEHPKRFGLTHATMICESLLTKANAGLRDLEMFFAKQKYIDTQVWVVLSLSHLTKVPCPVHTYAYDIYIYMYKW